MGNKLRKFEKIVEGFWSQVSSFLKMGCVKEKEKVLEFKVCGKAGNRYVDRKAIEKGVMTLRVGFPL